LVDKLNSYRDLVAWQIAIDFTDAVYTLTQSFPSDEKFGLSQQLRRAAVSISSNLAEGSVRGKLEFIHFVNIARGSLAEVETQLLIAKRRNYGDATIYPPIETQADRLSRVMMGLLQSLKKPSTKHQAPGTTHG
jgi:four helix bundle protein